MLYTISDLKLIWPDADFKVFNPNVDISGVGIDSRFISAGDLFFALVGSIHDGHVFIKNAIKAGATGLVCQYIPEDVTEIIQHSCGICIIVPDTLKALTELAMFNRQRLKAKVIGITGNIGKTTTKDLLKNTLSAFFNVHASPNSYNNHIGLPLTIANAKENTELLILEMGMNHLGEIEHLSTIAKPDIAIITTIAPAHVAFFNNVDEICDAKAEIFKGMNANGIAILNQENAYYSLLREKATQHGIKNIFTVGTNQSHIYIENCTFDKLYRTHYDVCFKGKDGVVERISCDTDGVSYHNALNTLFTFAVCRLFRVDLQQVSRQISKFKLTKGRGSVARVCFSGKNVTIVDDSYNASPEALKAAIKSLSNFANITGSTRSVAVLGNMNELGDKSEQYHLDILQSLIEHKVDMVITVGDLMLVVHNNLPANVEKVHFHSTSNAVQSIRKLLHNKDLVLFKASRGLQFERIIDKLYRE